MVSFLPALEKARSQRILHSLFRSVILTLTLIAEVVRRVWRQEDNLGDFYKKPRQEAVKSEEAEDLATDILFTGCPATHDIAPPGFKWERVTSQSLMNQAHLAPGDSRTHCELASCPQIKVLLHLQARHGAAKGN